MHQPVLYHEIIHALSPNNAGHYLDGTVGAGGHALGILDASSPGGRLLGLDLDPHAIKLAQKRLSTFGERVKLVQASYTTMRSQLDVLGWPPVDGILLDLGVSSMQFDTPGRGFSFRVDAPLDMRFDPQAEFSAADLVNGLAESELADLIYRYGEERKSRRIARKIVASRPVTSTLQLAEIVARVAGDRRSRLHPATRTFQALRIAVNKELESVETALPIAVDALAAGGRIAIIAFHSLEDRLVKTFFRRESQDCLCPTDQPVCTCDHQATLRVITRRPIRPEEAEVSQNPRARSALLRVAERK